MQKTDFYSNSTKLKLSQDTERYFNSGSQETRFVGTRALDARRKEIDIALGLQVADIPTDILVVLIAPTRFCPQRIRGGILGDHDALHDIHRTL